MRAFIAMDIDNAETLTSIARFQEQIRLTGGDIKILEPQNMHFTLLFLGEISEEDVSVLKERLSNIKLPAFEAELAGTGIFPNPKRINVLWVGVDQSAQANLRKVADSIVASLAGLRFKPDKQFEPHLTVARVKSGREREKILQTVDANAAVRFGRQQFKEFKLKKSDLKPSGPVYTDLHVFKLG